MHICFICSEYPPGQHGGIGTFTQTLGRSLADRGHRVTVVGCFPSEQAGIEVDQNVRIIRLAHTRIRGTGILVNGLRVATALRKLQRQSPIDVIEGQEASLAMVPSSLPVSKLIRMHGGHHFFSVSLGRHPRPWRSWLERSSFRKADHFCAVSRFVAETTRQLLNMGNRAITLLPNPVDVERFRPRPEIPEESGLTLFTGTVCEKKGIRQLVQAMPRILETVPHARLLVAGRDTIDPVTGYSFTKRLRELLPPHIAARVEFLGHVENDRLPELIARAEVCAYPSQMEAMPVAWLEGLASGKAVLASRTGPGPEVIEDGVNGLLCDPHDPASIADRAITLLSDTNLRQRLGEAARRRAVSEFSTDLLVGRNESFYQSCLRPGHDTR